MKIEQISLKSKVCKMKYYGLLILKIFRNILDVLISTKLLNQIIGGILFPKKYI